MAAPKPDAGGAVVACRVQVRSSRNAVMCMEAGVLKVALSSAPVDGKANAALCGVLADFFGVAKGRVEILSGQTSRNKKVLLRGLDPAEAGNILNEYQNLKLARKI